jgi:tetratricopeptide (TPR) repeat protein
MIIVKRILLTALLAACTVHAQEGGDIQAQILYAYQTEDTNTLADLIQNLAGKVKEDGSDRALRYHLAHAQYRQGLVLAARKARGADNAMSDCINELKPLIQKDVKSAEADILQAACYGELANLTLVEAVVLRSRAADRLKEAAKLEPRNPRLALISAQQALARAKVDSVERAQAYSQLKAAAKQFDEVPATSPDAPGWGHAEAYLALGRELQVRGDRVEARNLIEKALIQAPDFKAAQRQLALLAKP